MDLAVNVYEDNARITGGTKTIKFMDHKWLTQEIMAKQLGVNHEMIAKVVQIIEQVFIDIYCAISMIRLLVALRMFLSNVHNLPKNSSVKLLGN